MDGTDDDADGLDARLRRALAIDDRDDPEYWTIVRAFQRTPTRATLESMVGLCDSRSEAEQCFGLDVLGQLGYPEGRPFLEDTLPVVVGLFDNPLPVDVLDCAVSALGHLHDSRALDALLTVTSHLNDDVRFAVACSLPSVCGSPPEPRAVDALISLTKDRSTDVRDWATFGLGTQMDVDGVAVRAALFERVTDEDVDTRCEAMVGLARRRDARAVEAVEHALRNSCTRPLIFEAAQYLADERLVPALQELSEEDPDVAAALAACLPRRRTHTFNSQRDVFERIQRALSDVDRGLPVSWSCDLYDLGSILHWGSDVVWSMEALLDRAANGDPVEAARIFLSSVTDSQ